MTLQEMIDAAQKRVNESEGEARVKAEAELAALKRVQSEGYRFTQDDVNSHAGNARKEGRDSGNDDARKAMFRELGIDPEASDADEQLKKLKSLSDGQKSEAERFESERNSWKEKAERFEQERDEDRRKLRSRDRRDSIISALSEAGYRGKVNHALGAIDLEKVKENDGSFDASEAVKALKEDEFPGFDPKAPQDPETPPRTKKGSGSGSIRDRLKTKAG